MAIRDGSFDEFVTASARELMSTAFLICCNEADAEDVVQECLWRVARRWRRVKAMEFPVAYARQIVVNLAIDSSRKIQRRTPASPRMPMALGGGDANALEPMDETGQRAIEAVGSRAELLEALSALSVQQRAAITLRYFDDLSEADTAKVLGCGVGTVKSSTARGLARMRELLDPLSDQQTSGLARREPGAANHE